MRCSTPWWWLWTLIIACVSGYAEGIAGSCYQGGVPWEGTMNWTVSGKQCQRWDTQFPHRHFYYDLEVLPEKSLTRAENYCRMVGLGVKSPWCLTTDPLVQWELCPVPKCPRGQDDIYGGTPTKLPTLTTACYKETHTYTGQLSRTKSGLHCQRWDSQVPHRHNMIDPYAFPDDSIRKAENYCRDPDKSGFLWCYTRDPNFQWEACNVPPCGSVDCFDDSMKYMGEISHTMAGVECRRWDERVNPNPDHTFPDGSVIAAANYCRDPDGSGAPWCFTGLVNRAYCPVPRCNIQSCYTDSTKWQGKTSHTISGRKCQKWIQQFPNKHTFDSPNDFPDQSVTDAENYCRDPDRYGTPWCFTTDPNVQWEKCGVQRCSEESCYTDSTKWKGKVSQTISGRTCQKWARRYPHDHNFTNPNNFPDQSVTAAENYCRDPDRYGRPWCFTTSAQVQWEECAVQRCSEVEDYCWSGNSMEYKGTVSHTTGGIRCQAWAVQTPHRHNIIDSPDESLVQARNYCRDPDGKGAPWCYTVDDRVEWDYCSIPRCPIS